MERVQDGGRMTLSSPCCTDTPNPQLHMDHFPLKKNWKLEELLLRGKGWKDYIDPGRRGKRWSWLKTSPLSQWCLWKDLTSPMLLLEGQGFGAPHQASHPLGSAPETGVSWNSWLRKPRDPECHRKLRSSFEWAWVGSYLPQDLAQKHQFEKHLDCMWRRFICWLGTSAGGSGDSWGSL